MHSFKKLIYLGIIATLFSMLSACSDGKDSAKNENKSRADHVWKTQTDVLQSAKDVAAKAQESLNQQKEKIDESN
jgi:hypothetical protein